MTTLINTLTTETETLKIQYIAKSKEWAVQTYDKNEEKMNWGVAEWCAFLGIQAEIIEVTANKDGQAVLVKRAKYPNGFFNTANSKTSDNAQKQVRKIKNQSKEEFVSNAVVNAEKHYEMSIEKLAYRIEAKKLDLNSLKVKTAHIGNNIETVLTDGFKTVKAFTILAWGQINAPHYRYLIK